jgi:threonine dehydrogenase-like Zn-dependent dehydrogenase
VDCVGSAVTRRQAAAAVRPKGRVVLLGLHDAETALPLNDLVRAETQLVGSFSYAVRDFQESVAMLARGALSDVDGWLETRPLDAGPEVFAHLVGAAARDAVTKVVLEPQAH